MSMQPQAPPVVPLVAAPTVDEVLASLLHAVDVAARSSSGSPDVREVREFGAAALSFAQAYAILHPQLVAPQGVTPAQVAATVPKPPPAQNAKGASSAANA